MNSTCFTGNLTADPELKQTPDGTSVCTFCLGVDRPYSRDKTDFFYFTAWRQSAEFICRYGHKGDKVCVTGNAVLDKWETPEGESRSRVSFTVQSLELISKQRKQETGGDYEELDLSDADLAEMFGEA